MRYIVIGLDRFGDSYFPSENARKRGMIELKSSASGRTECVGNYPNVFLADG